MSKAKTPTFVFELPLRVSLADDKQLVGRLAVGKRLNNAVLQEALRRLDLMRQSKAWQAARKLKGKDRSAAFQSCQKSFALAEYALHDVATTHWHAGNFETRLGSHEVQKIATRVWKSIEEHMFGGRGRPRFKGVNRPLHSIEGKTNKQGIRWKPDTGLVEWSGLYLRALLPTATQDPYIAEALKARTKYCRIVWRMVNGERRWYVQLAQEGMAPQKYKFLASGQEVGLDLGPSMVAIVSDEAAAHVRFADEIVQPWAKTRKLQRAMDRSRRATNAANYDAKGRALRGKKWHKSKRYQKIQADLREVERKLAATRKKCHGTLVNQILGLGNVIKTEKLSYVAFQKCYGRSVKVRAPGAFVSLLKRRAENAGGKLIELPTWRLRMSQFDHVSGIYAKKPLSQRWHRLNDGPVLVQRDIYSAFLAQQVEAGAHNPSRLSASWAATESSLRRAGLCVDQSASGALPSVPTVAVPSERIARQRSWPSGLSRDAVAAMREPERPGNAAIQL